jgi:hypothetical protein
MSDMLQSGQAWLADQLKTYASRLVTYQRGSQQTTLPATIGRTLMKLDDGYGGVRMEWTDRDFLIQAADLRFAGLQVSPERGDRLLDADGLQTVIYEVVSFGGNPPWRFSDPFGTLLRIHTKRIGVS